MGVSIWEGNKAQGVLDKLDKQNALLEVMVSSAVQTLSSDWAGLGNLADTGLFGQVYSISDRFTDEWTDIANTTKYTFPMQLNHIGDVELQDGEILTDRPFLQLHYATPFGVQFSHQRAFTAAMFKVTTALTNGTTYYWLRQSDNKYISFKAPSTIATGQWLNFQNNRIEIYNTSGNLVTKVAATIGASAPSGTSLGNAPVIPAGPYYFTLASNWGRNVVANAVVSFTTTDDLQFGDKLCGCYGAPDQARANWKVYPVTNDGKTIGTALTIGTDTSGTNLGSVPYSSRSTTGDYFLNSIQEVAYGWNRWAASALRQYCNSDSAVNAWWTAYDAFDVRPDELSTKAGWLSGWSDDFKEALKTIKVVTYPNTVHDDTSGNTPDITYDKVFIPSLEQIYVNPQKAGEGEYHGYWKRKSGSSAPLAQQGTYPNMITYAVENHTSPQSVRLRSAYRGYAYNTWDVSASGIVNGSTASYSFRFSPLVVL